MDVKILDYEMNLLGVADSYTALEFRRSWQGVGSFTMTAVEYDERLFCRNNLIMLGHDVHRVGIIRSVEAVSDEKGVGVAVSGQTLSGLAAQRILLPQSNNSGYFSVPLTTQTGTAAAETILKAMINACLGADADNARQLKNSQNQLMLSVGTDRQRGLQTNWGCRYPYLHEELQALCEYCDCGYEIYPDLENKQYAAEYLPGIDRSVHNTAGRSWVVFSKEWDSVNSVHYMADDSGCKNVAYCGGQGDGESRAVLAVTNENRMPTGFQRREIFLDCGELEIAETDTALSLPKAGRHKLKEYSTEENLSAEIGAAGAFRYQEHFDLGDLVTVRDKALNKTQDCRITEITESYEPEKTTITVTLGQPPRQLTKAIRNLRNEVR